MTAIIFIATASGGQNADLGNKDAIWWGIFIALSAWLLGAVIFQPLTSIQLANVKTYGEFADRLSQLRKRIGLCTAELATLQAGDAQLPLRRAALQDAQAHLETIERDMSSANTGWIRGHGYNNLWTDLHSAEEAMLEALDESALVREGLIDEGRLLGSQVPAASKLLVRLRNAVYALDPTVAPLFLDQFSAPVTPPEKPVARGALRGIRNVLNEFSDAGYDRLARLRNIFIDLVPVGGIAVLILVVVAIHRDITREQMAAGLIFYLAGMVAGLFYRWYVEIVGESTIQDFGLSTVKLFRTVVFSGLAGLAGVFLWLAISGSLGIDLVPNLDPSTSVSSESAGNEDDNAARDLRAAAGDRPENSDCTDEGVPKPSCVADINDSVFLFFIFIAAIFGTSPEFIPRLLKLEGDRYVAAIQSATAAHPPK